jgi:nucleoid-associated protein YgaU
MSLTLGTVTFTVDELPERIELGGTQSLAVKRYVGGQLDIQTLGAFDDAISWDGTLWFTDALARAQAIDAMRVSGARVAFRVGNLTVDVVVARFRWTYANDYLVPYHIELQPFGRLQTVSSAQAQGAAQVGQSFGSAASAMLSSVTSTSSTQLAETPVDLAQASTAPPQIQTATVFGAAANTPVGTIARTLSPAGAPPVLSTIAQVTHLVSAGESLWSIASHHYGNGSMWPTIAAANAITNPNGLAAGLKLIIPNPTKAATQ